MCALITFMTMSKNITLKLDEKLVTRVRHIAVSQETSVSAWVAGLIEDSLRDLDRNVRHRREALQILERGFSLGGEPLKRKELHDR